MTGRELIVYILENGLEDDPIYENGKFIGYMTSVEAAQKFDVGVATIWVWVAQGKLDGLFLGGTMFIPVNAVRPIY